MSAYGPGRICETLHIISLFIRSIVPGQQTVISDLDQFEDSAPQQIKQRIPPVEGTQDVSCHLDDNIMADAVQHLMFQDHPAFRPAEFMFRKKNDWVAQSGNQWTGIQPGTDHSHMISGRILFPDVRPDFHYGSVFTVRQSTDDFL